MPCFHFTEKELSPQLNRFIHSPLHLHTALIYWSSGRLIDESESVFINVEREKRDKIVSFDENEGNDDNEREVFNIQLDFTSSAEEIMLETENLISKENEFKQKYGNLKHWSQIDKNQKDKTTIFKSNQCLDKLISTFLNESISNSPNEYSSLFRLPKDTIQIILEFFDISSILNFEMTCRDEFYNINCDYNDFKRGFWGKYSLKTLTRYAGISADEFLDFTQNTLRTDNIRDAFLATGIIELLRLKRYLKETEKDDFHGIFTFRKLGQNDLEKIVLTHFKPCRGDDCPLVKTFYEIYHVNPENRLNIKRYLLAPVHIRNMKTQNEENQMYWNSEQMIRNTLKKSHVQTYVQWLQGISKELEKILPTISSCSKFEQDAIALNHIAQALYRVEYMNNYVRDGKFHLEPADILALHLAFLDPLAVSRVRS